MKFALPPVLSEALKRLAYLEFHPFRLWRITYNRPRLYRLMRLERRRNLLAVAMTLIRHMDIPTGRIVRLTEKNNGQYVFGDCSLSWLAAEANVSPRTLCRVLADMHAVNWIERDPQTIRYRNNVWAVATVVRRLTDNFFHALGLSWLLTKDREYIKQNRQNRGIGHLSRILWKMVENRSTKKSWNQQKKELADWCRKNSYPLPVGYG